MFSQKNKIALGISLCFTSFVSIANTEINENTKIPLKEIGKIAEVFSIVNEGYVDEVNKKEIIIDGLKGMVKSLDPYSTYLSKEEMQDFSNDIAGTHTGIGVLLASDEKGLKIETVFRKSPAEKSNIKSGDIIVAVKGKSVLNSYKKPFDAIKDIKGEKGTSIKLSILRKLSQKIEEIEVIRDKYDLPSVGISKVDNDFGLIELAVFNENTSSQLKELILNFEKDNEVKGYILDMRSNPGGLLSSAIEISDFFLNEGIIVSTKGRKENDVEVSYATKGEVVKHKPMVVLINNGTASAAEIVAGALQDQNRAIIIGQRSYGKGSVQTIVPLSDGDGDAIKITIARYYTPNGRSIQAEGIVPDLTTPQIKELKLFKGEVKREEDNFNHIENDTDYKAKKEDFVKSTNIVSSIEKDYDLYVATNTLKTLNLNKQ